jgi:hypothetical protein
MTKLSLALERLKSVATVTPEFQGSDVYAGIKEQYDDFLRTYPSVAGLHDYLEFLRLTGGAHAHNQVFSLVLYGFGGYVVPSFDEGLFLDRERYFLFGEALYPRQPEPNAVFFAFDTALDGAVCWVREEHGAFTHCADSFSDLLLDFAEARYPGGTE